MKFSTSKKLTKPLVGFMSALSLAVSQAPLSGATPESSAAATAIAANIATPTTLSSGATEAAQILGILPKVQRLMHLRQSGLSQDPTNLSDEELGLKVDLLGKIMGQSLEVRVVADRIDRELSWAYSSRGLLESRRQRNLNYLFAANFMQGGILGIVAGNEFLIEKPKVGTQLLLLASSIGLGLSTLAFAQQRYGGSKTVDGGTTVLADVLDLKQAGDRRRAENVMTYLNSATPGQTKTRKEILLENWKKASVLRASGTKELNRLAALTPAGEKYRENINILNARIRMLYDTQWAVEGFDSELLELLRAVDI